MCMCVCVCTNVERRSMRNGRGLLRKVLMFFRRKTLTVPRAQREKMSNGTSLTKFLLLAFTDMWELQLLHFSHCYGGST